MSSKKYIVILSIIIICITGSVVFYFVQQHSDHLETASIENDRNPAHEADDAPHSTTPAPIATNSTQNATELAIVNFFEQLKKNASIKDYEDSIEPEETETSDDETSNSMDSKYFTSDEPDSEKIFSRMDLNHDGLVSFTEYQDIGTKQMFMMLDIDGDEQISPDEIDSMIDGLYEALEPDPDS